jgi:uncharacterized protein (DUF433 family)
VAVVSHPHVEVTPFGYVITGTKVPVRRLWFWHVRGVTFETLKKRYVTISPAKILCALAFGYDNREVLEKELELDRALVEEREMQQLELPCPRTRNGR